MKVFLSNPENKNKDCKVQIKDKVQIGRPKSIGAATNEVGSGCVNGLFRAGEGVCFEVRLCRPKPVMSIVYIVSV